MLYITSPEHIDLLTGSHLFFFFYFFFIYVTKRQPAREGTQQGSERGRSRLPAEEPDVGLDPRTPGSCPEPKADA